MQVLRWLAAHPELTEIEAEVLPDHHWMIHLATAAGARRCVHAPKPTRTRTCWSGRASEILADSFIPLASRTDMRLLERLVGGDGATTTRWLRFPGAVWAPAAVHEVPSPAVDPGDERPSWYPRTHRQSGFAQLPRADVRWMSMILDGEPPDVSVLECWRISSVPVHAPGITAIELQLDQPDYRPELLCVRADAQWRCSETREHGLHVDVSHDLAYPLGDRFVVQRSITENGGAAVTTLEILAQDGLLLTPVGGLQIGGMLTTVLPDREYGNTGDRRVQLYIHGHSPRGTCIAIAAPEHEHLEIEGFVFKKRALPGGKFTDTPVPDRLELVDGVFGGPTPAEPPQSGVLPSRTLTGLWQLDGDRALVRVDPDPAGPCPPS